MGDSLWPGASLQGQKNGRAKTSRGGIRARGGRPPGGNGTDQGREGQAGARSGDALARCASGAACARAGQRPGAGERNRSGGGVRKEWRRGNGCGWYREATCVRMVFIGCLSAVFLFVNPLCVHTIGVAIAKITKARNDKHVAKTRGARAHSGRRVRPAASAPASFFRQSFFYFLAPVRRASIRRSGTIHITATAT